MVHPAEDLVDAGVAGSPSTDASNPSADAVQPPDPESVIIPSNGAVGPLVETGSSVGLYGEFDTSTDCAPGSPLGNCSVTEQDGRELCVCRMDDLSVGDLRVVGSRALVILAWNRVEVSGVLDVGGHGSANGPGAAYMYAAEAPGWSAGVGGSHASPGGNAGAASVYGDESLEPLLGGMRGQDCCQSAGGGGGGALQITAGHSIEVTGTVTAGGGGGDGGSYTTSCLGGAGGGSGGSILLEASSVVVTGTVTAAGGGGGGGGSDDYGPGQRGQDALAMTTAAPGGAGTDDHGCPLQGYTRGGNGGWGAPSTSLFGEAGDTVAGCLQGATSVGAGGGGGGLGRVHVATKTGCVCTGHFLPQPHVSLFGDASRRSGG